MGGNMLRPTLYVLLVLAISIFLISTGCKKTSEPDPQPTKVANPIFSPIGGNFNQALFVSLSCATEGAVILYTIDGTEPSKASFTYTEPITVTATTTIKAKATKTGLTDSDMANSTYTITNTATATPIFTPPGGDYYATQTVVIACPTPDASIFYSIDGSAPTLPYTAPISVITTKTIKAKATKTGLTDSGVATANYVILPPNVVATLTFNPPGGSYTTTQNVTIACATAGATIRYTVNGSDPTESSPQFTSPITVSATTVVKAKAYKTNWISSDIAMASYNIGSGYNFSTWEEVIAYLDSKDYVIVIGKDDTSAGIDYLWIEFGLPEDVTTSDAFTLQVNGVNVPLSFDNYGNLETDPDAVPVPAGTTQLQFLFKRNNITVINDVATLPAFPQNLVKPSPVILTQPIPISWTLPQNYQLQFCGIWLWGHGDDDGYEVFVNPSDRSYVFPANCVSLVDATGGSLQVGEGNIADLENSMILTMSFNEQRFLGNAKTPVSFNKRFLRYRNK
jgi:hypothetical protein